VNAWRLDTDNQNSRLIDVHQKGIIYNNVAITSDSKLAYACGSDRVLVSINMVENCYDRKPLDINIS